MEKILVVINVTLFAASLSADNTDEEVSTVILYIMLLIGQFVTTSTCLSGAHALKRKVYHRNSVSEEPLGLYETKVIDFNITDQSIHNKIPEGIPVGIPVVET